MAVFPEARNSIIMAGELKSALAAHTNLTAYDASSKTKVLVDVLTEQTLLTRQEAISAFRSIQADTATGAALIKIGEAMGVPVLLETFANVIAEESNFAFYVDSGTFGNLNGGNPFVIPAGTRVWTDPNENETGSTIGYKLVSDVTCEANSSVVYCSAKAENSGPGSNIGGGVIRNHGATSYSGLKIINFYPVLNGRDRETDTQYRYRIITAYQQFISSNDTKTHLTSLRIPGVLDTRIVPGYYGLGTVGVVVLSVDYMSSTSLIAAVQSELNNLAAPGAKFYAVPAACTYVDMEMELTTTKVLSATEQTDIGLKIKTYISEYFRTITLGGTLYLNDLVSYIRKQIGSSVVFKRHADRTNIFSKIYLRRGYSTSVYSEREELIQTSYGLADDEYIDLGTLGINFL